MAQQQRCFAVTKNALNRFKLISTVVDPNHLASNEILLGIDKFAFTANNMTYAHAGGPPLNYWNFYDKMVGGDGALGIIPVWGFGTVTHSRNPDVPEGSRHYGFYPMANSVKFKPSKASPPSFTVSRDDPDLASVYNQFLNTALDPFYSGSACESAMMVYRPLFLTSYFLADYCMTKFKQVPQVILTSASSKTAFALAHCLKRRGADVIGLTSGGNVGFCEMLGLYKRVYEYNNVGLMESNGKETLCIDMAGSHEVNLAIDRHFGSNIVENVGVGMTHNTVLSGDKSLLSEHARATRTFFFAPAWIRRRVKEDATVMEEAAASYVRFTAESDEKSWLKFNKSMSVEEVFRRVESNSVDPNTGLVTRVI